MKGKRMKDGGGGANRKETVVGRGTSRIHRSRNGPSVY